MIEKFSKKFATSKGEGLFMVPQLDGIKAMKLFLRLGTKFGPILGQVQAASKNGDRAALLGLLLTRLEPEEFDHVRSELLASCVATFAEAGEVDTEAGKNLGEIFKGHPFELGALVFFALEVNFGSFFEGLKQKKQGEGLRP